MEAEHAASEVREERDAARQGEHDQTLVERAQQGDTEAFGELIAQHRSKARGWAKQMTGDPHMADDVVQDAYSSLYERGIFRAYFFRQLSPDEIASMYQMTTGSIYTYIHRSRKKLRKEHIRVSLGLLPEKGGFGLSKSKVLQLPDWLPQCAVKTTFVDSIGRMLASIGDRREMSELMGVTRFAFRMKISDQTTFADSIYIFDWRQTLQTVMEELGYTITMLCGQLPDSPIPLLGAVERFPVVLPIEESVIPFIRKYIDLGKPVLYFDTLAAKPYVHEWSVIYGYDDEQRIVHLTDPMHPEGKTLSFEDVTDNPVRFAAGIDGVLPQDEGRPIRESEIRQQAERIVRFAFNYARHGCDYRPKTSYLRYTSGLAAYNRWIGHLRNPHTVPNRYGMGQLSAVFAETKRHASLYLRGVPFEGEAMRLTLLASDAYEQAAEAMEKLSSFVPFTRTSEMLVPDVLETCAEYLEQAKEFETAAVGYLEKALTFIGEEKGSKQP